MALPYPKPNPSQTFPGQGWPGGAPANDNVPGMKRPQMPAPANDNFKPTPLRPPPGIGGVRRWVGFGLRKLPWIGLGFTIYEVAQQWGKQTGRGPNADGSWSGWTLASCLNGTGLIPGQGPSFCGALAENAVVPGRSPQLVLAGDGSVFQIQYRFYRKEPVGWRLGTQYTRQFPGGPASPFQYNNWFWSRPVAFPWSQPGWGLPGWMPIYWPELWPIGSPAPFPDTPPFRDLPNLPGDKGNDEPGKPKPPRPDPDIPLYPKPYPPPRPDPPFPRPPKKTDKERKLRLAVNGIPAKLFHGVTEGMDFVEAIHKALPREFQAPARFVETDKNWSWAGRWKKAQWHSVWENGRWVRKQGYYVASSPVDRVENIRRHWEHIDWNEAIRNLVENQLEDTFWGYFGSKAKGLGIGPAL